MVTMPGPALAAIAEIVLSRNRQNWKQQQPEQEESELEQLVQEQPKQE